ncbi:hypothetical protein ACLX1H_005033 [Fusarium chlamydosporum]
MTNSPYDFRWKVLVLGDSKVGKTNIVGQFTENQFDAESKPTIGVKPTNKITQVGSSTVKVNIWDCAGQERFRAPVNYYYNVVAVLLVYDITSRKSFEDASKWLDEIREHGGPDIVVMLVGNKSDLGNLRVVETQRAVRTEEATLFARKNKILFAEISARYPSQVESTFQTLLNRKLPSTLVL